MRFSTGRDLTIAKSNLCPEESWTWSSPTILTLLPTFSLVPV